MKPAAAAPGVVAVAYSGGRDSTALLFATLRVAHTMGLRVVALHVHHGLQARADDWLAHCQRQCRTWQRRGWPVTLAWTHLHLQPSAGDSVEAVARRARYQALRHLALEHGADIVLLGHHRTDQAETFLLQALRGGGVAGQAGMPVTATREGVTWLRPWLKRSRSDIETYVGWHGLAYVDDESNADDRYARNRLRRQVWPTLVSAFPQAEAALADAAAWAGEALACLEDLAMLDLASLDEGQGLHLSACRHLGAARGRNALRVWIRRVSGHRPPASLLERLWSESSGVSAGRWALGTGELRLYRGRLSWIAEVAAANAGVSGLPQTHLSLRGAGAVTVPGWGGVLHVERVHEGGVPWGRLRRIELRVRQGGEQFQAGARRPLRALKKQFQAAAVPAWHREGPLVYDAGGQLLFVPGLGMDARAWAEPGRPQWRLRWEPLP